MMIGILSGRPLKATLPSQMNEVAATKAPLPSARAMNAPGTEIQTR